MNALEKMIYAGYVFLIISINFAIDCFVQSNAKFSLSVEPRNERLQKRAQEIPNLRESGQPTVRSRNIFFILRMQTSTFLCINLFHGFYEVSIEVSMYVCIDFFVGFRDVRPS